MARKTYNATICIFRGKRRVKKSLAEARIRIERRLYKEVRCRDAAPDPRQRHRRLRRSHHCGYQALPKTGHATSLRFRSRKDESQSIKPYTRSCKALLDSNNRPRLFQMYTSYMKPIHQRKTSRPSAHVR